VSIANKILASKYLGHVIQRTPDGRNGLLRRWQIEASKTNPAELEAMLFQPEGTADGVDTSNYAFVPKTEKVFADTYLVAQSVRESRRGVDPANYVLEKTYEQADGTLRLLTSPLVQTEAEGRRYAQTRHVVLTSAWNEGELTGSLGTTALPAPYGGEDGELENFRLQKERTETEGFVMTVVVRDWVEATEASVRVGRLGETRGPDNLRKLSERLVQLASADEEVGDIGTEVLAETGAVLFSQKSQADKSVRVIDREWAVPGVISESTEFRHNRKLEILTVRAFGVTVDTPNNFVLVNTSVDNPDGFAITNYNFAKGAGEISRKEGQLHGGRLTTLRVDFLTAPNVTAIPFPAPTDYFEDPYELSIDESNGYKSWQITYIKGEGEVSVTQQIRHNTKLTLTTVEFVTAPDADKPETEPNDFYGVETGHSSQRRQGYTLWRLEYAKGEGEISRSVSQRITGVVNVTEIRFLTGPGVTSEPTIDPSPGDLVDFGQEEREGYRLWTLRFVSVTAGGIISTEDQTRNNGALKLRTIRRIGEAPANPGVGVNAWAVVSLGNVKRDLWTEFTTTFAKGSGEVSRREGKRQGSKLETLSIRHLTGPNGSKPSTPATYVEISSTKTEADGHVVWDLEYVKGSGRVSTSDDERNNGALLLKTIRFLGEDDEAGSDEFDGYAVVSTETQEQDGYVLTTVRYAKGEGEVSRREGNRQGSKLETLSIRHLTGPNGSKPSTPATYVEISSTKTEADGHVVWDLEYVKGSGRVSTSDDERNNGALLLKTIRFLGEDDEAGSDEFDGYVVVSTETQEQDGYVLTTVRYAKGEGEVSRREGNRQGSKLETLSIRHLTGPNGSKPSTPATYVEISSTKTQADGHVVWDLEYVKGSGEVSREVSTRQGTLTTVRVRHLTAITVDTSPISVFGFVKLSEDKIDQDGYRIWTVTMVNGNGRISTSTEYQNSSLEFITIRFIGQDNGSAIDGVLVNEETQTQDGYTVTIERYAIGEGRISFNEETRNNEALTFTTVRYIGNDNGSTPEGTLISTEIQDRNGHTVTTERYAKGSGEVSRREGKRQGSKLETLSIRHLTGPNGSKPSTPATYVEISSSRTEADGHVVWDLEYAKGNGEVSRRTQKRNGTMLDVVQVRMLTAPNEAEPTPIGLSAFTQTGFSKTEADGHVVWDLEYAKGNGMIQDDKTTSNGGKLILYTRTRLSATGDDPSTPAATIGGTVTEISRSLQEREGHKLVTVRWAEGSGEVSRNIQHPEPGIRYVDVVWLGSDPTVSDPVELAGIVLQRSKVQQDGHAVYRLRVAQGSNENLLAANDELSVTKVYRPWRVPGVATINTSDGLRLAPPTDQNLEHTIRSTFQTSNAIPEPIFSVTRWAEFGLWIRKDSGGPTREETRALGGYLAPAGSGFTRTNQEYLGENFNRVEAFLESIPAGPPPYGQTINIAGDSREIFEDVNGVKYYRKTIVTITVRSLS
jgi:hypothetical protein